MKIAAVVILYHPSIDTLSNIQTYYDYVDKIFVFDNTEAISVILEHLLNLPKVMLIHNGENQGIAKRLNAACEMAIKEEFNWLLTLDQDTRFIGNAIIDYFNCFKNYLRKEEVAMFGTCFSRWKQVSHNNCSIKQAEKLITSGSLLNLSLVKTIGQFDEQLFIDAVDYDYCFRAQMAGYHLIQFSNIYILHTVGSEVHRSSFKTLFLIKKKKEVHSPLRCYYMYRNMLYLTRKYKEQEKAYTKQIRAYVLSRIKVSLFYGRKSLDIIKHLMLAKSDFKMGKMGKKEV